VVPDTAQFAKPQASDLATELDRFARSRLPDYMAPSSFIFLDALPMSTHGKVDRVALSTMNTAPGKNRRSSVQPRTSVEDELAKLWGEALGTNDIGVHDDFFRELGGHSLLATRILSRVRNAFQLELPLRVIFETPTVAGMADRIETLRWAAQARTDHNSATAGNRDEGEL
jgi:acyl carrier protein